MNYTLIEPTQRARSVVEQVLLNRGLDADKIARYIEPTEDESFDPHLLDNIIHAAKTLLLAIMNQKKIYVQIDSDCDGYTSSALLLNYLHRLFPSTVENNIAYGLHSKKHHGINMDDIPVGTQLVVVPDASSNEVEFHKQLFENDIMCIILDHHHAEVDRTDPAIIVNNQMCSYPNKALSGVGIVYKFCCVLDEIMRTSYADGYLDLVAVGMIADMMDMRELETRYLTVEGLKDIRNPFILELAKKNEYKIKDEFNPFTISWYVAPFINAVTRSGSMEEKQLLFKSMLEYEAYRLIPSTKRGCSGSEELLVEQSVRTCGNVKSRQEKEKKNTLDIIYNAIQEQNSNESNVLIIQLEQSLDNNLNGLLANHIMGEFGKPTLILTKRDKDGVITWEGSARGYQTKEVEDWRQFIMDSGYCMYAEGHPFAFGVGFTPEKLEGFKKYIDLRFEEKIEKNYKVDFIWTDKNTLDDNIINLASYRHLWGQEVGEPLVLLQFTFKEENVALMGKGTLKFSIPGTKTTCIQFGYGEEEYFNLRTLFSQGEGLNIQIIGYCRINEWNGNCSPQIEIKDFSIERIVGYDF